MCHASLRSNRTETEMDGFAVLLEVAFIRMTEPLTPRQALPERIASADDEDGACDEGAGVAGEQERDRRDGDR
jgi:hypothetical protein